MTLTSGEVISSFFFAAKHGPHSVRRPDRLRLLIWKSVIGRTLPHLLQVFVSTVITGPSNCPVLLPLGELLNIGVGNFGEG